MNIQFLDVSHLRKLETKRSQYGALRYPRSDLSLFVEGNYFLLQRYQTNYLFCIPVTL